MSVATMVTLRGWAREAAARYFEPVAVAALLARAGATTTMLGLARFTARRVGAELVFEEASLALDRLQRAGSRNRLEAELHTNATLMERVIGAQTEVARQLVEEWRATQEVGTLGIGSYEAGVRLTEYLGAGSGVGPGVSGTMREEHTSRRSDSSRSGRTYVIPAPSTEANVAAPYGSARLDASVALLGESPGLRAAVKVARQVARSTAAVLVQGESGTGKELLARLLHEESDRARSPFVAVNVAAIPGMLLESQLFGHEKGVFTGAIDRRKGIFERANGGTIFLDEIQEMPLSTQTTLLRVLEEREFRRVGGEESIPVDMRVVAATDRDLAAEVAAGRFREDLYYRLAVIVVHLPALRERGGDVELLARHYVEYFARKHGRGVHDLDDGTVDLLRSYGWPGNVRQLRNVVERALLVAEGPVLLPEHLPNEVRLGVARPGSAPAYGAEGVLLPLREVEHLHIRRALALAQGNLAATAELLGIHSNTLRQKLRRLNGDDDEVTESS